MEEIKINRRFSLLVFLGNMAYIINKYGKNLIQLSPLITLCSMSFEFNEFTDNLEVHD